MTFSAMTDAVFNDPFMAEDAIFTPAGDDPVPVRAVVRQADAFADPFGQRVVMATTRADVRVSEVATPAKGDTLTIDGVVYTVNAAPMRDATRLVWTLEVVV